MLRISELHASYGRGAALQGVTLDVGAGEVVCLVGRNGAGKTSTMRAIVQELIHVTGGSVLYEGENLAALPSHEIIRRGIGYVPEDRRVFASLTVDENLRVPARPARGDSARWTLNRVHALFPQLREYHGRIAGVLSGGEQQMLAIARALLTGPRLLLLDEPHEGLAPKVVDEIIVALRSLKAEGVSMLISEQSVRTIRECADRVYVIDRGTTVYSGTPAEFEANAEIARKYLMIADHGV